MKEYLQATIDFIDHHVDENLTLDNIADHIGFSKYYLNQVFSIYTGYSIMAYTRLRKLEYATELLKTDMRIIDIALELGYSSERAFSRALTKALGYPPSYFRKATVLKSRQLVIYDLKLQIDEHTFYDYFPQHHKNIVEKIKKEGISNMMKYLSDVNYIMLDSMTVVSGIKVGKEPEGDIISAMNRLVEAYNLSPLRSFGFDSPIDGHEDPMVYRGYEFWHVLSDEDLAKLPMNETFVFENIEFTIKKIPKHRYATLRITEPFVDAFERIPGGWKALYSWLEANDFKEEDYKPITDAYCLEEVKNMDGGVVMDIFTPVG